MATEPSVPPDALDPGDDDEFPWLPRTEAGYLDTERMPIGIRHQLVGRQVVTVDVTPTVTLSTGQVVPVTDVCQPPPGGA